MSSPNSPLRWPGCGLVEVEVRQQVQWMPAARFRRQEALAATVWLQHGNELTTEGRTGGVGLAEHEGALRAAVAVLRADDRCRLDRELAREAGVRAGQGAFEAGLGPHVLGVALVLLDLSDRLDLEGPHDGRRLGLARPGDRHPGRDRACRDRYREPPSSTHTQPPSGSTDRADASTPAPYVALHRGPVDLAGVRSPLRASWRQVPVSERYTPSGLSGGSSLSEERRQERRNPPREAGCVRYRYGDSNPGFRRERAAS